MREKPYTTVINLKYLVPWSTQWSLEIQLIAGRLQCTQLYCASFHWLHFSVASSRFQGLWEGKTRLKEIFQVILNQSSTRHSSSICLALFNQRFSVIWLRFPSMFPVKNGGSCPIVIRKQWPNQKHMALPQSHWLRLITWARVDWRNWAEQISLDLSRKGLLNWCRNLSLWTPIFILSTFCSYSTIKNWTVCELSPKIVLH